MRKREDGSEYEPFEEQVATPEGAAAWAASLQAIGESTSYEDYLARVMGLAGLNLTGKYLVRA